MAVDLFRVREGFAVPSEEGPMRAYTTGAIIAGTDPIATTHRAFLEPAAVGVEQATAAPGERRRLNLPSGVTQDQAVRHRTGHAHTPGATAMVHHLPPEDINSPASVFAPGQPGLGVVADDVPDSQNLAGAPRAADITADLAPKLAQARTSEETPEDPLVADLTGANTAELQGDDAPGGDSPEEVTENAKDAASKSDKARTSRSRGPRAAEGNESGSGKDS